ncbi:MAG: ribulose-phosphate 3-epimerase [Planctomycetales bacterium]|nr:ribulose-phosphate 3-epimerase [Planctomycetales bacterium]
MSRRDSFRQLGAAAPAILPSLLLCDFSNLEREIARLEEAGAPGMHLDVMDGNFVPNLTYGMPIVQAVRKLTQLPIDVHLMIRQPERYLSQFRDAGADLITIHVEAVDDPRAALGAIRDLGVGAGIAINPGTPFDQVVNCLDACDLLLVMSVPAGFGGQSFDRTALDRLRQARELAGSDLLLEVDGGVNSDTIAACAEAGAQLFVVGSAIFRRDDYRDAIGQLQRLAVLGGG